MRIDGASRIGSAQCCDLAGGRPGLEGHRLRWRTGEDANAGQVTLDDSETGQLYDMKKDPGQRMNVIAEYPERAAQLKALLSQIREQGYSEPRLK
mgnify:CR=1 FL=1|jgi:hypothetical protein